ncbi:CAP domain-containing protein [Zopfochytrium polystomum]|nr:CAP domain-containing protein [Zopfochytrium polystomum]
MLPTRTLLSLLAASALLPLVSLQSVEAAAVPPKKCRPKSYGASPPSSSAKAAPSSYGADAAPGLSQNSPPTKSTRAVYAEDTYQPLPPPKKSSQAAAALAVEYGATSAEEHRAPASSSSAAAASSSAAVSSSYDDAPYGADELLAAVAAVSPTEDLQNEAKYTLPAIADGNPPLQPASPSSGSSSSSSAAPDAAPTTSSSALDTVPAGAQSLYEPVPAAVKSGSYSAGGCASCAFPIRQALCRSCGYEAPRGVSYAQAHNSLRALYGVPMLVRDEALEESALGHLRVMSGGNCAELDHGDFANENLFSASTSDNSYNVYDHFQSDFMVDAVNAWNSEARDYFYASKNNTDFDSFYGYEPAVGHFSAMMWSQLVKVGCAALSCNGGASVAVSCQYHDKDGNGPNYVGINPFLQV